MFRANVSVEAAFGDLTVFLLPGIVTEGHFLLGLAVEVDEELRHARPTPPVKLSLVWPDGEETLPLGSSQGVGGGDYMSVSAEFEGDFAACLPPFVRASFREWTVDLPLTLA